MFEGGYVDDPADKGGATNMGITRRTLAAWRGSKVTKNDVLNLGEREARQIYYRSYWMAVKCSKMPAGVDVILFDAAVNHGPVNAGKILQRALSAKVKIDGIIGTRTIKAVNSEHYYIQLVENIAVERALIYAKGNPKFHKGWYRRLLEVYDYACAHI